MKGSNDSISLTNKSGTTVSYNGNGSKDLTLGSANGLAANVLNILATSGNANYNIPFVSGTAGTTGTNIKQEYIDSENSALSYNPSENRLRVGTSGSNKITLGASVTMTYNSSTQTLDFNFE